MCPTTGLIAAMRRAVATQVVIWVSWPQACMTAALDPVEAGAADVAGEGQAGLLLDRQRVHVGAQQQDRAGPVRHHRDHAGLADAAR